MKLGITKINIIDKYIAKQILFGLFIVSSILLGIAWFSQIIRLLSYLVNMQAVGMSARDLARPALWIATIITLICFYITLHLSPIYAIKYRTFLFDANNDISAILIQEGEFNQITDGLTLYVKSSKDNILSDIFINDQRVKNRARTILAEQGIVSTSNNNVSLSLVNGSIQEKNKNRFTFGSFERYTADLGVIAKNSARSKKATELKFFELIFARELGYATEDNYSKYLVELHKRLLEPLYNILFTLIALIAIFKAPLNKRSNSRNMIFAVSSMAGIQMHFLIYFVYTETFIRWYMRLQSRQYSYCLGFCIPIKL